MNEKIIKMEQHLKCHLTKEEIAELGTELARKLNAKAELEADKKAMVKQMDEKVSALDAEIMRKRNILTAGFEFRNVSCEMRFDFDGGVKRLVRLDTSEEVNIFPLSDEDRQLELADLEEGAGE